MTAALVFLFVVIALVAGLVAASVRILREYERAVVFRLGRLIGQKGPGLVVLIPGIDRMVRVGPAHDRARHPAAGPDHARQRVGQGQRRRLLPRRRCRAAPWSRSSATSAATSQIAQTTLRCVLGTGRPGHAPRRARAPQRRARADHRRADRSVGREGHGGRGQARRDLPRTCSARWRGRPRPSARGAPRSSTPRARSRRPPAAARRGAGDRANPAALQLRYLQTLTEIARWEELDDHLPAAARHHPAVPGGQAGLRTRCRGGGSGDAGGALGGGGAERGGRGGGAERARGRRGRGAERARGIGGGRLGGRPARFTPARETAPAPREDED